MSERDEMRLPPEKTCGDCVHFGRCSWYVGAKPTWTSCDFHPSRFTQRFASPPEGEEEESRGA